MPNKPKLLVVDDEPFNIEIIEEHLSNADLDIITATGGQEALDILDANTHCFDAIILDRMMPDVDGMQVLKHIKDDSGLKDIPVIMQTALSKPEAVIEGIKAGAYYYLTKPYATDVLHSIIEAAINENKNYKSIQTEARKFKDCMRFINHGEFSIRTLEEARNLATFISGAYPTPERVVIGLVELLVNAIEHGNLGISYKEKSELLASSRWVEEVERRQNLPENTHKQVLVTIQRDTDRINITIEDQGNGFDFNPYTEFSASRAHHSHGRGIAMAKKISFDKVEYNQTGNCVTATVMV